MRVLPARVVAMSGVHREQATALVELVRDWLLGLDDQVLASMGLMRVPRRGEAVPDELRVLTRARVREVLGKYSLLHHGAAKELGVAAPSRPLRFSRTKPRRMPEPEQMHGAADGFGGTDDPEVDLHDPIVTRPGQDLVGTVARARDAYDRALRTIEVEPDCPVGIERGNHTPDVPGCTCRWAGADPGDD